MKLCKFGGSSLASANQFRKVRRIIEADPKRKIIVVSAPGKAHKDDNKITDLLYLTYSHLRYKVDYHPIFEQVKSRYYAIKEDLSLDIDLDSEFNAIEEKMAHGISEEELVSRGEYLSAKLLAAYLGYQFIDAKDLIKFSFDGKVKEEESYQAMKTIRIPESGIVVPGFYGTYPNGRICLFSRGGSDVTGSYLSIGFDCEMYENWTDVCGIMMCDPKTILHPRSIHQISYAELRELSYSGASVLHEDAILPLESHPIPLCILNTNEPDNPGTIIRKDVDDKDYLITGIAGKKNYIVFTFVKKREANKMDVIIDVLKIFQKNHVSIEHVPTSIDSFSVVFEQSKAEDHYYDLIADLKQLSSIQEIKEDDDVALVAVIGRNMRDKAGTSGRLMSVFGAEKINIELIDQGRDEISIIIGVSNKDFERTIKALYNNFAFESGM